jgi:hypothetical protein
MRNGTIISSIGLGVSLMFLLMLSTGAQSMVMIGLGLITFFLGLGFILNAMFFTVPKKQLEERSSEADIQRKLDSLNTNTNEFPMPPRASVTEHTTKHLKDKNPLSNS